MDATDLSLQAQRKI